MTMPDGPEGQRGVVNEVVCRRQAKHGRLASVAAVAVSALGVSWGLAGIAAAHAAHHHRPHSASARHHRHHSHRRAVRSESPPTIPPLPFDIHLTPTFEVGQAGWNFVVEENGAYGGGDSVGVMHPSTPFVSVSGDSVGGSREWRTIAVTLPEVSAVLVEGSTRIPTETLPGLPYGLRVARVVSPYEEPQGLPGSLASHQSGIRPMVALGWNGEQIAQSTSRETRETPTQGTVHKWTASSGPAQGSCKLHASGEARAESGAVLSDIRPYPGQIFASAFLPCNATSYSLDGQELRAYVLLDAANPGALPAVIPGLVPLVGLPGVYGGDSGFYGGPGDLVARRSGAAWVAVEGAGNAERTQLLEELSATVAP